MGFPTISEYKEALRMPEGSFRTLGYLRPVAGVHDDCYFMRSCVRCGIVGMGVLKR